MESAIQVIWWIGLIGALLITLVILKQVSLVLRSLRHILTLAHYTRDAARGIAANTEPLGRLDALEEPAERLRQSADALAAATTNFGQTVRRLK